MISTHEEKIASGHDENVQTDNNALQSCQQALKECQAQVEVWKDKSVRLTADFDNFKRRLDKEQSTINRLMQADMLRALLPIIDNFDRAFSQKKVEDPTFKVWVDGFELIRKELQKFLEQQGVQEIKETSHFDPVLHEAVMSVASRDHASGSIVQVLQKGYMFKDQVLRPAKVSIAQ